MTDADRMTEVKAEELQRAFSVFNQVSQELTQAYEALQGQVVRLTSELEVANGKLRRQYQEKEALSERLSLLLNALPAGVVAVDGAGVVTSTNPAAQEMLGRDPVGQEWRQVAKEVLRPSATPDEWCHGERRLSTAESPLDSSGGRIVLLHDITSAHAMKASLERSQRLAAMGEMAASLAHQLRTPLATALLYSSNLGTPDLAEDARMRFADKATTQLKRLERLIQDVLLFARGESIGREVVSLDGLMLEASLAVEALMRRQGVEFIVEGAAPGLVVVGDHKALSGALINLLENALQACEQRSAAGIAPAVHLALTVSGGRAHIAVRDTGPGLAPEMVARIFEPFFTTRGQGTGLGLAIALGVARAHGGTIDVRSTPGEGAEFILELPAGTAPAANPASPPEY